MVPVSEGARLFSSEKVSPAQATGYGVLFAAGAIAFAFAVAFAITFAMALWNGIGGLLSGWSVSF